MRGLVHQGQRQPQTLAPSTQIPDCHLPLIVQDNDQPRSVRVGRRSGLASRPPALAHRRSASAPYRMATPGVDQLQRTGERKYHTRRSRGHSRRSASGDSQRIQYGFYSEGCLVASDGQWRSDREHRPDGTHEYPGVLRHCGHCVRHFSRLGLYSQQQAPTADVPHPRYHLGQLKEVQQHRAQEAACSTKPSLAMMSSAGLGARTLKLESSFQAVIRASRT
jgi:hypothetical protein